MKLAIFDIDGTLADDFPKFHLEPHEFYSYYVLTHLRAFTGVLDLVQQYTAIADIKVVFLTGRENNSERATFDWLKQVVGNTNWDLYTRGPFVPQEGIVPYKLAKIFDLRDKYKPDITEILDNETEFLQVLSVVYESHETVNIYKCQDGMIFRFHKNFSKNDRTVCDAYNTPVASSTEKLKGILD